MVVFGPLKSLALISHKIRVTTEEFWHFHTVVCEFWTFSDNKKLNRPKLVQLEPILSFLALFKPFCPNLDPLGPVSDILGHWAKWEPESSLLALLGPFWLNLNPFDPIWTHLDLNRIFFGNFEPKLVHCHPTSSIWILDPFGPKSTNFGSFRPFCWIFDQIF